MTIPSRGGLPVAQGILGVIIPEARVSLSTRKPIEKVVITGKTGLATGVDIQIIAGADPQDVVPQLHVDADHMHRITSGLVHSVVEHPGCAGSSPPRNNALIGVGVDKVVYHQ